MMGHERVPSRASKRWSPWTIFLVTSGLVIALLLSILIGGAVISLHRTGRRVADELARIREAREPTSKIELEAHYHLPPGVEDATELWLDAIRPLLTEAFAADAHDVPLVGSGEWETPPPVGEPWDDLEAACQLLRKYRRSLDSMHDAADLGGAARYPVDFNDVFHGSPLPAVNLRSGARLLALEAHVSAHRGDPAGAARAIRTMFMLARSLDREPILTSQVTRHACDWNGREVLRLLLPTVDFSDADLAALQDTLRAIDYHAGLHQAMLGERAMGVHAFENPDVLGDDVPAGPLWHLTQPRGFLFYLEHMGRLAAAAKQPWPQAVQAAGSAEAMLWERFLDTSFVTEETHTFVFLRAPYAFHMAFDSTARNAAMNDAADAAIAVERYRRAQGRLPERLDELVPDFLPQVPIDPFDGAPLKYIVREKEYLTYSIGPDRVDNGGTAHPESDDREPDVVFRVQRPETSPTHPDSP